MDPAPEGKVPGDLTCSGRGIGVGPGNILTVGPAASRDQYRAWPFQWQMVVLLDSFNSAQLTDSAGK